MKHIGTIISGLLFFLLITNPGYAQKATDNNIDVVDYLSLDKNDFYKDTQSMNSLDFVRNKSNVATFGPVGQLWDQTPWLDEEINFIPSGAFISIGDVNGDGVDDLGKRYFSVADERDSDISSIVNKSLIYFGGAELSIAHDQLLYSGVYPLGDLNGDGFSDAVGLGINGNATLYSGSSSGLTSVGTTQSDTLLSIQQRSLLIRFGKDLNGDDVEDLFGYYQNTDDNLLRYFEVYGAANFDDISFKEVVLSSEVQSFPNTFQRFSIGDTTYLAFNTRDPQTFEYRIQVFKTGAQDSLSLITSKVINGALRNFLIDDFNNNGNPDLLLTNTFQETFIYPGVSDTEIIFSEPISVSNSFSNLSGPFLLGDIMDSESSELLFTDASGLEIVNYDSTSASFNSISSINTADVLFDSEFFSFSQNSFNDSLSAYSGFNTFSLPIQSDDKFGNVIFKTQQGSNDIETELLLQNSSDFSVKSRAELFHLSDLENDGNDNFAILERDGDNENLVIMNGLNDANPGLIENTDTENYFISHAQAGFFNNSTDRSIAVLLRPRDRNENQTQFRLYSTGNLSTPYLTLQQTDLSPTLNRLDVFSNLGDINNDGFDDLGFSPTLSNESEKVFIILGGASISNSPDITLNLNDDFPNLTGQTTWGATVIQGLGDINGDGIDDFVLGDAFRYLTPELAQENSRISGVMYLMYGQDTAVPSFDGPDFELHPDTSNTSNRQWFFGSLNSVASGDFDGDGTQDVVSIAFHHSNSEFDNGVGALTYFFGKDGFTNQPDTTIPIRTEYIYNSNQNITEEYSRVTGRAILQSIPDLNGDNADELLFVGNAGTRRAVLYEIGDSPTEVATALYAPPNTNFGLNPSGNFINKQYLPLVGDYNGDGRVNFLGYQTSDRNFRDTPVYMFEVDNMAVSIEENVDENPTEFSLKQNYPNPFNPSTNISFSIPRSGNVEIVVYNILGQEISKVVNNKFNAGAHSITFDASSLASGIYLYRIKSGDFVSTKRMTLIK